MIAPKVSEQVAALESEVRMLRHERDFAREQLKAKPPFTREQADRLCRELWDVFTGRMALQPGQREVVLPIYDGSMGSVRETALPYSTGPMFRTVRVSW